MSSVVLLLWGSIPLSDLDNEGKKGKKKWLVPGGMTLPEGMTLQGHFGQVDRFDDLENIDSGKRDSDLKVLIG